jgi:Tfp pilus assembly protein PilO
MIKHLSPREKHMFYSAVAVIGAVLVYVLVLDPLIAKWTEINGSISKQETLLLKNLKILAQKEEIAKLYDQYAENIKMKGSPEEETAVILREIENVARSSNTYIADIKPQKVEDKEFYKEYYIELEAEGSIPNLAKFIYDLQSSKQILKVRYLRLNPKGEGDVLKGYMVVTKILIP